MREANRSAQAEDAENRISIHEWLGAVLALATVFVGATITLGVAYWLVTRW